MPEQQQLTDRIFNGGWRFAWRADNRVQLPPAQANVSEIAFWGRSNVGKSSLINAVAGQNKLARSSNTPGRTRAVICFDHQSTNLRIVDLPGYGYAKASYGEINRMDNVISHYLNNRSILKRVYLLLDARHGIKDIDRQIFTVLDNCGISYQLVLAKCDKLSRPALADTIKTVLTVIATRPAAYPEILPMSVKNSDYINNMRHNLVAVIP